jgi:hypothetical protein
VDKLTHWKDEIKRFKVDADGAGKLLKLLGL